MSRLIDADDLIEYIKNWDIGNSISSNQQKEFIDCVKQQFTVFNVDKVIKQLENRSSLAKPVGWTKSKEIIIFNDAIEIVKGGGIYD